MATAATQVGEPFETTRSFVSSEELNTPKLKKRA